MTKQLSQTALYGEVQTSLQKYKNEVGCLSDLTQEQEQALIECAREGDRHARDKIITSCLSYVMYWAGRFYRACKYQSWRIEYEELVAIGNLELVHCFERALGAESPIGYLKLTAKLKMMNHCQYYQSIIVTPREENTLPVESLDMFLFDDHEKTFADTLEANEPRERKEKDFTLLYTAIHSLTKRQQEVITRHYGFDCAPEDLATISNTILVSLGKPSKTSATAAYTTHSLALTSLHKKLSEPTLLEKTFPCPQCGEPITRQNASPRKRYCSQKCVLRASRQKRAQEQQSA